MSSNATLATMSRQYIEEHHVLVRYLAGQLTDTECEAFEAYYAEHPQVLQELEVTAKLKLGLALLHDAGELARPARQYWLLGLAVAAILLAAITITFWLARPAPGPPLLTASISAFGEARQALLAETHTIERTRNRGFDASFALPATASIICLRVLPERPAVAGYSLRLNILNPGAAPRGIADLRALQADDAGLVSVYLDSARLHPGSYEIVLTAESDPTAASSFLILVRPTTQN